ncbi:hypothetical protein GCM10027299_41970 [Larkinella ripae]
MKRLLFALLMLGSLAACQKEDQAVAPQVHSSARTGAVTAGPITAGTGTGSSNPWTNSGLPKPNVPLERMVPWPQPVADSVTRLVTIFNGVWHQEFCPPLAFPVKVFYNGAYKGQIHGYLNGNITSTVYPDRRGLVVRLPKNIDYYIGILDSKGYYYEQFKTSPSQDHEWVMLSDASPNKYYWKLKYGPQ